jgi:hypothetical protein
MVRDDESKHDPYTVLNGTGPNSPRPEKAKSNAKGMLIFLHIRGTVHK